MKSADEIKLGMECCEKYMSGAPEEECCHVCNYAYNCAELKIDSFAYIQQLESKLNQAVEDIRMLGRMGQNVCPVCAHYNHGEGNKEHCVTCIINRDTDNFEWRGGKE